MQDLWTRLERWAQSNAGRSLHLRSGTSPDKIARAEATFGLSLSPSFRESLLLHDGQDADAGDVFEWMPGCSPLASLDAIVARWTEEQNDLHDDNPPIEIEDGKLHSVLNHARRIPVAGNTWWDGDITYLDHFPGPNGADGQLITLVSECDFVVLGGTFAEALGTYVDALESGAWVYDPAKGRVTPREEPADDHPHASYAFAQYAAAKLGLRTPG
jgi:cell wall assembly regulator SMI1